MEIPFDEAVKHIGHQLRVIRQDGHVTIGCDTCCKDVATEEERFISAGKIVLCEKYGCAYIETADGTVLTTPMNSNGTISILNADWGDMHDVPDDVREKKMHFAESFDEAHLDGIGTLVIRILCMEG